MSPNLPEISLSLRAHIGSGGSLRPSGPSFPAPKAHWPWACESETWNGRLGICPCSVSPRAATLLRAFGTQAWTSTAVSLGLGGSDFILVTDKEAQGHRPLRHCPGDLRLPCQLPLQECTGPPPGVPFPPPSCAGASSPLSSSLGVKSSMVTPSRGAAP